MGIDIGGAFTIAGVSGAQALKIAGSADAFTIDMSGRTYYPNQIGFIAGYNTDPGWIMMTANAWNIQNYHNVTTYNKGGGYITGNGRFTAPVTGSYLLHWTIYQNKASAPQGNYTHPMFWVNGGAMPTSYRIKAYFTPTGYSSDGEIADIFYLNAGDYVEVYIYCGGSGIQLYRAYSHVFRLSGGLMGSISQARNSKIAPALSVVLALKS